MTKKEIMEIIEATANTLNNGEYDVNDELTDKLVYANRERNEEYGDAGVIIEKDKNGKIYTYVDSGECYPTRFTAEEFAESFAR